MIPKISNLESAFKELCLLKGEDKSEGSKLVKVKAENPFSRVKISSVPAKPVVKREIDKDKAVSGVMAIMGALELLKKYRPPYEHKGIDDDIKFKKSYLIKYQYSNGHDERSDSPYSDYFEKMFGEEFSEKFMVWYRNLSVVKEGFLFLHYNMDKFYECVGQLFEPLAGRNAGQDEVLRALAQIDERMSSGQFAGDDYQEKEFVGKIKSFCLRDICYTSPYPIPVPGRKY